MILPYIEVKIWHVAKSEIKCAKIVLCSMEKCKIVWYNIKSAKSAKLAIITKSYYIDRAFCVLLGFAFFWPLDFST